MLFVGQFFARAMILVGIALSMVACDPPGDAPARDQAGQATRTQMHIGNGDAPRTLDPHKSSLIPEVMIIESLFQGLVDLDPAGNFIPGQAESWTISEDGLVYVFKLRDGLVWSDGTPISSEDFVFGLQRVLRPETDSDYAPFFYAIRNAEAFRSGAVPATELGVTAVSDQILEIVLSRPKPSMIELLSHASSFPVPRHVIAERGQVAWSQPGSLVSNGPYKLANWQGDGTVVVERNDRYHDASDQTLTRIHFHPSSDTEAALDAFLAGDLDILRNFPLDQTARLRAERPASVHVEPQYGTYFYIFNTSSPGLEDPSVRRALSMAVDREVLVTRTLGDVGYRPALSLVPPLLPSYRAPPPQPWHALPMAKRRAMALELMAAAGYSPENPLSLRFRFNTSREHRLVAEQIVAMWADLPVAVTLIEDSFANHDAAMQSGDFDVGRRGWVSTFDAPEYFLNTLTSSAPQLNAGRYFNEDFDRMVREALALPGAPARAAALAEAEALMLAQAPIMPLYFYVSRAAVSPEVTGWVDNPTGRHRVYYLGFAPPAES